MSKTNSGTSFEEKVVVVMGGTSGLNRGIAEAFARHGARVAVASRDQLKVDDTVSALEELGAHAALGRAVDVRDYEGVCGAMAEFRDRLGPIDVLVSGAAGNFPALAAEMSVNAFRTVIDIDLMGTLHVMKAAYQHLSSSGASVINISAPQAYLPHEAQSHVCAAKAGVDQITRTLALEWGGRGIRVNSVVPGYIDDTEGLRRLAAASCGVDRIAELTPLGRLGSKQDIADMCLFLASDTASFVSGQVINVDGGLFLRGSGEIGAALGTGVRGH